MKKEPAAMFLFWSRFSPTFLLRRFSRSSRNLFDLLGWCWYRGLHGRRLWSRPRSLRRTFLWGLDGTFASLFRFLVGSVGWSFTLLSPTMEGSTRRGRRNRCRLGRGCRTRNDLHFLPAL